MSSPPTLTIVGLDDHKGKFGTFSDKITRKHLSIIAIILGILSLALLISVIIVAHKYGQKDTSNTNELCLTPGCLSAATYQLHSMDSTGSSDLCKDFYTYACSGWQKTHAIQSFDVERTILGDIIDRRDMEIERMLEAPISRPTVQSWEYKLKTYYSECLDDYARQPDSGKYMVALVRDPVTIDGWFVLDNSAENASQEFLLKNQSIYTQISHIHGDLGVLAVFGLRTRFDELNPNVKRLEFYPAGLSMDVNDYLNNDTVSEERRSAYQQFIIEVLSILAQEAGVYDENLSDRTFTVANDVYTIERFLADSLQRNPTNNKPRIVTLEEMSAEFSFDFVGLMEHELGDPSVITPTTSVYLINPMYFTDAFELLANNEDPIFARMIHNYFRWRLLWTYIDDLSYNYIHSHRVFLDSYYSHRLHSSNEHYCLREVVRRFPIAIQRLYTKNSTRYSDATSTIQNIFNLLKDGLKQYITDQAKWMPDAETKNLAKQKIDALTAAIGYTKLASDDALLDNYYDKFAVNDESHFQNAYNYHRFYRWTLSASLKNPDILDHWDLFEARTSRLFDYIAIFNRLFVVGSAMHEPLVNSQWPMAVNMGSIGVLLADKLFASIDVFEGRSHLPNGTRSDWWGLPTIIGYNDSRNCITDYYVNDLKSLVYNINGIQVRVELKGEPFSPTTLRHISALRFTYETLKKNDPIKTFKMPGTNFTREQTFFLAYAQTQCYQREELLQLLRTQLGAYDEKTALNAALIHMPEFAQAFKCQSKENKCI